MRVGLRPTGKPVDELPDPRTVRAVFQSRLGGRLGNWPFYLDFLSVGLLTKFPQSQLLGELISDMVPAGLNSNRRAQRLMIDVAWKRFFHVRLASCCRMLGGKEINMCRAIFRGCCRLIKRFFF